jgi:hypothetical protein
MPGWFWGDSCAWIRKLNNRKHVIYVEIARETGKKAQAEPRI